MEKENQQRAKRLRNLIGISSLSAIVLLVAAFAWFIGMQTVSVNQFEIEIATVDSLMLSLDGKKWDTKVSINEDNYKTVSYDGNTNYWGGKGLKPISTVGEMDVTYSRMKMYEKSSLTKSPGGFRTMASRVPNATENDLEGYVVFDLFVRNMTGTQYIPELEPMDEEAIYLTTDSKVVVADNEGVENTGIENSVRVAFAQIGRVHGDTTDHNILAGITCVEGDGGLPTLEDGVTGICRTAQIYEPNDTKHVASAIKFYNTACFPRLGADVMANGSYNLDGSCTVIENDIAYPTYAINDVIASDDNVDTYDGESYNTYTGSTKLQAYPYFTDTHKDLAGVERPAFMTLSPNSITKIRIYVYLEGQDIDNYDFSSIGKRIMVNFGFTKERFEPEDIGDYGDQFENTDETKPVITLNGDSEVTVAKGTEYIDEGATALDDVDEDITDKIKVINPVDTSIVGTYYVAYDVSDWAGNWAERVIRTVIVE